MTTVLGLKAEKGKKGIIMASDLQGTAGDQKSIIRKLHINKSRNAVFGIAGIYDQEFENFLEELKEDKYDIEQIVETGIFPELLGLNLNRWDNQIPDDTYNGLFLATNFEEEPKLYTCWPLGGVEERLGIYMGSGSQYVEEYLDSEQIISLAKGRRDPLDSNNITLEQGIDLAETALNFAIHDLYSGGLDMMIKTKEEIYDSPELKEERDKGRKRAIKKIKNKINYS